jgi:hypothetical protein
MCCPYSSALNSITAAIAVVISSIIVEVTYPSFSSNRWMSAPRSCSVSTADVLVNPFSESGSILICQRFVANLSSQLVIGTMSLIGSFPTASELTTIAGRVLRISDPRVGSKLTRQTSPLVGNVCSVLNYVTFQEFSPLCTRLVIILDLLRLFRQDASTLYHRQLQERALLLQGYGDVLSRENDQAQLMSQEFLLMSGYFIPGTFNNS